MSNLTLSTVSIFVFVTSVYRVSVAAGNLQVHWIEAGENWQLLLNGLSTHCFAIEYLSV